MARVRVVMIDADGDGGTVLSAIASLWIGGGPAVAPSASTPAELPAPSEAPVAAKKLRRAPVARPEPVQPKQRQEPAKVPAMGSVATEVYAALEKAPMTSSELVKLFEKRCSPGSVYTALTTLRATKRVETRRDDDGDTKNFRV